MKNNKYYMEEERDPEFGVDSRYKVDSSSLMEARLLRIKNLSKEQIDRAKCIQLKINNDR